MVTKQETPQGIEHQRTVKAEHWLPDWCIAALFLTSGLATDWYCAFEWFSGKNARFSGPVLGVMGLIVVLYACIALVASRLVGGKWRAAVLVFALASYTVSGNMLIWWDVHR